MPECERREFPLRKKGLDLAEVERNVGRYVFSTADLDRSDGMVRGEIGSVVTVERGDECLPVVLIGDELGVVQMNGDELVYEKNGDLGAAAPRLDESGGRGMEELVAQRPGAEIWLCVEESASESGNSCRHIGAGHGLPSVVVFADEVIAERLVRLGLYANEEFPRASGAEDDEVGIPVFATKTVKWDDALRIGVGQDEVTGGK